MSENTTIEIQRRGMLTERIKKASLELLGYEMCVVELRLMPYIVYVMMNEQKLDPRKINDEERSIFSKWRSKGYVEGGMGGLRITKEFWHILTEIVMLGYVDLGEVSE